MTIVLILILLVVVGGAITLIVIGMRENQGDDPLQERLAEYAMRGQSATLEEIELSQPLTERVVFPLARKFGQFAVKFTPQNALQNTAHRLELAGNPRGANSRPDAQRGELTWPSFRSNFSALKSASARERTPSRVESPRAFG